VGQLTSNGAPRRPTATRCLNVTHQMLRVSGRRRPSASKRTARGPEWGCVCLTVRVSDRIVRHLISTGHLSPESRESALYVTSALEAWIYDNVP
jgi:hypothetical protein